MLLIWYAAVSTMVSVFISLLIDSIIVSFLTIDSED